MIKTADWIVDMGPDGGSRGGLVVAEGTPEDIAAHDGSHTGAFLRPLLEGREAAQPKRRATRKAAPSVKKAPAKKSAATKSAAKKATRAGARSRAS